MLRRAEQSLMMFSFGEFIHRLTAMQIVASNEMCLISQKWLLSIIWNPGKLLSETMSTPNCC